MKHHPRLSLGWVVASVVVLAVLMLVYVTQTRNELEHEAAVQHANQIAACERGNKTRDIQRRIVNELLSIRRDLARWSKSPDVQLASSASVQVLIGLAAHVAPDVDCDNL